MPKSSQSAQDIHDHPTDLECIKRLIALQLILNGATQKQVAAALGVSQSTVSRMFPPDILPKAVRKNVKGNGQVSKRHPIPPTAAA